MRNVTNDIETLVKYSENLERMKARSCGVCSPTDSQAQPIYEIYDRWGLDPETVKLSDAISALSHYATTSQCGHEMHDSGEYSVCVLCGWTQDN